MLMFTSNGSRLTSWTVTTLTSFSFFQSRTCHPATVMRRQSKLSSAVLSSITQGGLVSSDRHQASTVCSCRQSWRLQSSWSPVSHHSSSYNALADSIVDELPYRSRITNREERLPFVVGLMSLPGTDLYLMDTVRKVLQASGRPTEVQVGRKVFG